MIRHYILFTIALCALALACKSAPPPKPADKEKPTIDTNICALEAKSEEVWNPSVRDQLDLSVKIMNDIIEAWEAENFTVILDTFTDQWATLRESACRAHYFDQTSTQEQYQHQENCFIRVLTKAQEIIDMMKEGDRSAIEKSSVLMDELNKCVGAPLAVP